VREYRSESSAAAPSTTTTDCATQPAPAHCSCASAERAGSTTSALLAAHPDIAAAQRLASTEGGTLGRGTRLLFVSSDRLVLVIAKHSPIILLAAKMLCHGCKTKLKDNYFLKCNGCKSEYCYECLNISNDKSKTLTPEQIESLSCPYCRNVTRRKNNDDTPCRQQCHRSKMHVQNESMNISFGDPAQDIGSNASVSIPIGSKPTSEPVTLESISRLLDLKLAPDSSFMNNLRSALNKDIEKMVTVHVNKAIEKLKCDFTTTTDYLASEHADLVSEVREKDNFIKQLETDLTKSQISLNKLQFRIHSLEKISRDMNLEIHEVPEHKNENLSGIFKKLCDRLQVDIPENDVRGCRRVSKMDPSSERPRNILVSLSSQRLRDLFLSSVTRYNKAHPRDRLSLTDIGFTGETRRIYVAEHLSPETKEVHSAARKFCRDNGFKFVWVRFGQIYIRKDEQSPAHHIKSIDHLNKISC
jgi:hypothetical protein